MSLELNETSSTETQESSSTLAIRLKSGLYIAKATFIAIPKPVIAFTSLYRPYMYNIQLCTLILFCLSSNRFQNFYKEYNFFSPNSFCINTQKVIKNQGKVKNTKYICFKSQKPLKDIPKISTDLESALFAKT